MFIYLEFVSHRVNEITYQIYLILKNKLYKVFEEDYHDFINDRANTKIEQHVDLRGSINKTGTRKEYPIGTNFKPINIDIFRLWFEPCLSTTELDYTNVYTRAYKYRKLNVTNVSGFRNNSTTFRAHKNRKGEIF